MIFWDNLGLILVHFTLLWGDLVIQAADSSLLCFQRLRRIALEMIGGRAGLNLADAVKEKKKDANQPLPRASLRCAGELFIGEGICNMVLPPNHAL